MNNIIFKTTFLKGEDGNNILRIDKTATSGLVDTYTITLTDGTTTTFNVTNGSSIATIEKTATVGMVDTYTITLTDGSTSTFEVTNGANVTIDDQLDANSTNPVQNKVVTGAISGLSTAVSNISNNLNGFTFYPAGEVNLVASVADDSYYTDANDKYILADSPTGESLIDDITYKSLASNEDLRGEVGADTVSPFNNNKDFNINDDWEEFENFVGKAQSKTYNLESGITYIFFCSMVYDYSISCFSVKDNVITYYIQSTSGQAVPNITCVNNVLTLSGFNDGYDRFIGAFKITNKGVKLEVSPQTPSNTVNLRKGCIMHLIPDKTYFIFETGNYATSAYMFWVKNNTITYIKQGNENIPITCVNDVLTIGNGSTDYGQNRVIIFH